MSGQDHSKPLESTRHSECFILLRIWRGLEHSAVVYWVVIFAGLGLWSQLYGEFEERVGSFPLIAGLAFFLLFPSVGLWRAAIGHPKPWAFRTKHLLCFALPTMLMVHASLNTSAEHKLIGTWRTNTGAAICELTFAPDHNYTNSNSSTPTNNASGEWAYWGNQLLLYPSGAIGVQKVSVIRLDSLHLVLRTATGSTSKWMSSTAAHPD